MKLHFYLVFALFALPQFAMAGAWPEAPGQWLDINTLSYYQVSVNGYNEQGRPTGNGTYSQVEFSPYVEYGLTDRWTIGVQPRLQEVTQSGLPGTASSYGLVQANLFARYQLYRDDQNVVSVQGQFGAPGVANNRNPLLVQPNAEYEARLLYGRNLAIAASLPAFIDAEAAYRVEANGVADQFRGDVTVGLKPSPNWLILAQSFNTVSVGSAVPGETNYNLYRVELSVVRDISEHASLQLGAWHDVAGHNIALGDAGVLALWLRF